MDALTVSERRNKIIELVAEEGRVSVNRLSRLFGVSSVAIRQDLTELDKQGMLTRVHGGAVTSYKSYYDMSLVQRSNANAREKKQIAAKINEMIKNNDTLIMNAGTTPIFVMREIKDKRVTIITNSIALALEGAKNPNFKIILLGGDVDSEYQFTYGISVVKALEQFSADMLILSVDGVDAAHGISTFYHQEAEICRCMIASAKRTVVAADYSKLNRVALTRIDNLTKIHTLVTSNAADQNLLKKLKSRGIEVIVGSDK